MARLFKFCFLSEVTTTFDKDIAVFLMKVFYTFLSLSLQKIYSQTLGCLSFEATDNSSFFSNCLTRENSSIDRPFQATSFEFYC